MLSTFEQLQIELNFYYFFFNVPTTTEIYTLSLHDALPISRQHRNVARRSRRFCRTADAMVKRRSEEHTSELQSRGHLVCRLLLEKKKKKKKKNNNMKKVRKKFIKSKIR